VIEDVLNWLRGEPMQLSDVQGGVAVEHLSTGDGADATEDPGYLQLEDPSEDRIDALQEQLAAGQLPEFVFVRPF
jgi:hypothetical protein